MRCYRCGRTVEPTAPGADVCTGCHNEIVMEGNVEPPLDAVHAGVATRIADLDPYLAEIEEIARECAELTPADVSICTDLFEQLAHLTEIARAEYRRIHGRPH